MSSTLRAPIALFDYLRREESNEVRHEYVGGAVHAMVGGTLGPRSPAGITPPFQAETSPPTPREPGQTTEDEKSGGPAKQHIVIGVRIERRVEVDQIDALGLDALAQHVEIVAVIQVIGHAVPPLMITPCKRTIAA